MTYSMTAFARGECETPWGRLACELRSVNHRYLDLVLRVPETLRALEPALRERIRARLDRGKVECTFRLDRSGPAEGRLHVDDAAASAVIGALVDIRNRLGPDGAAIDPVEVLRWPGVVREPDLDAEALADAVTTLADAVLDALLAHRQREGTALAALIEQRLVAIEAIAGEIGAAAGTLVTALRERLRERARALAAELDPLRLEQEVALLAQKADIAEELDRLTHHVGEMRRTLAGRAPVGRRLDFLAQELNREANTLAAKATGAEVANRAVDLKVLIEQIREQIQNLE